MDEREHTSEDLGLPLQRVLTDTGDRSGALVGAAVGFVLVAVLIGVAVLVGGDASPWLYAGLVLVVAVVLWLTYRRMLVWAGWGNPQLFLPSSDDLKLGDHIVVRFRRVARRGSDPAGLELHARLVAEEVTQQNIDVGPAGTEHVERVHEAELQVLSTNVVNQVVEADIAVDIPLSAPPSLHLPSNQVRWRLVVGIAAPNAPDDDSTFPVMVAPSVAARLQSGGAGR